jgi:type IV secretory pathway VirB2 component (pilin)
MLHYIYSIRFYNSIACGAGMKETIQSLQEILKILAGKVTAILAFAVLVIVFLGLSGASIPPNYLPLVYIVVIGAMLTFVYEVRLAVISSHKTQVEDETPVEVLEEAQPSPASEQPSQSVDEPSPPPVTLEAAKRAYLEAVIADSRASAPGGIG